MNITHEQREILKSHVHRMCSEDPSLVQDVIEAATEGVKAFARRQSDISSKMAFAMTDVLDTVPDTKFKHFTRAELLDILGPCLDGTAWMKKQRENLANG